MRNLSEEINRARDDNAADKTRIESIARIQVIKKQIDDLAIKKSNVKEDLTKVLEEENNLRRIIVESQKNSFFAGAVMSIEREARNRSAISDDYPDEALYDKWRNMVKRGSVPEFVPGKGLIGGEQKNESTDDTQDAASEDK